MEQLITTKTDIQIPDRIAHLKPWDPPSLSSEAALSICAANIEAGHSIYGSSAGHVMGFANVLEFIGIFR